MWDKIFSGPNPYCTVPVQSSNPESESSSGSASSGSASSGKELDRQFSNLSTRTSPATSDERPRGRVDFMQRGHAAQGSEASSSSSEDESGPPVHRQRTEGYATGTASPGTFESFGSPDWQSIYPDRSPTYAHAQTPSESAGSYGRFGTPNWESIYPDQRTPAEGDRSRSPSPRSLDEEEFAEASDTERPAHERQLDNIPAARMSPAAIINMPDRTAYERKERSVHAIVWAMVQLKTREVTFKEIRSLFKGRNIARINNYIDGGGNVLKSTLAQRWKQNCTPQQQAMIDEAERLPRLVPTSARTKRPREDYADYVQDVSVGALTRESSHKNFGWLGSHGASDIFRKTAGEYTHKGRVKLGMTPKYDKENIRRFDLLLRTKSFLVEKNLRGEKFKWSDVKDHLGGNASLSRIRQILKKNGEIYTHLADGSLNSGPEGFMEWLRHPANAEKKARWQAVGRDDVLSDHEDDPAQEEPGYGGGADSAPQSPGYAASPDRATSPEIHRAGPSDEGSRPVMSTQEAANYLRYVEDQALRWDTDLSDAVGSMDTDETARMQEFLNVASREMLYEAAGYFPSRVALAERLKDFFDRQA